MMMKVSKTKWTWRWYLFSTPWFGVKLHWIRPTPDEWHTHPWNGFSLIFGWYCEQLVGKPWKTRFLFNFIGAHKRHRTMGNTLTIFFHGPRVNENWEWGDKVAPWRGLQVEEFSKTTTEKTNENS